MQGVKKALSEYFILEQLVFKARDSRYLPWLVSLMDKKIFPENVKILSWNYDFQVQLASREFGELENINYDTDTSYDHSPSIIRHYPCLDPNFHESAELALIHLNSIAGFGILGNQRTSSIFQEKHIENVVPLLAEESEKLSESIHFAWDQSDYHNKLLRHVKQMIWGTTIVVVIGYSFPFFNREIDKKIFEELKATNILKKIYYQDPRLNGQQLKAQFDLHSGLEIVHISETKNFHIPFEY